jgi:acetylornithine deacetylase/succinyl-diaminopimelate desuccinylase-like protein
LFQRAALLLVINFTADAGPDPVGLLQQYVRIDTTNPPGNEARAKAFLAGIPLADYGGVHGNNERISLDNIRQGSELLEAIVELVVY